MPLAANEPLQQFPYGRAEHVLMQSHCANSPVCRLPQGFNSSMAFFRPRCSIAGPGAAMPLPSGCMRQGLHEWLYSEGLNNGLSV